MQARSLRYFWRHQIGTPFPEQRPESDAVPDARHGFSVKCAPIATLNSRVNVT
jgi:hypothetical protein